MATLDVKDASGTTVTVNVPNADGRAAAASSRSVCLSTEDKASLDAASNFTKGGGAIDSNTQRVVVASDAVAIVGGITRIAAATITRPADTTAYAVGDLVANSTTAGSVTPFSLAAARVTDGSLIIRRIRLRKSSTSLSNAQFRVHLFNASPTVAVGDNAAFNSGGALSTSGVANYLGYADITLDTGFSDGAAGFSTAAFIDTQIKLSSGSANIFALLEARAAYTPGNAETFTITVEVLQD